MKRIFLIFIIALAFASCQKVMEIDIRIAESQLSLNGIPLADSNFFVNFGYCGHFLDSNLTTPIGNADMTLYVNGNVLRPDSTDRCNYFFDYAPREHDSLFIRIDANGKTVTAHTTIPNIPQISTPEVSIDSSGAFTFLRIKFAINDNPDTKDRYYIRVIEADSGRRYQPYLDRTVDVEKSGSAYFLCGDAKLTAASVAASEAIGGYFYSQLLTTDQLINGQQHETSLSVLLLTDTNEIAPFKHTYLLSVENVTPERYRYLQDVASAASMTQLITEPAPVYSNVAGGLGIFAGAARTSFPLITIVGPKKKR